ncbi:MAG TPA: polyamine ABC transporter substrate-binding protein [Nevskiales bacterium]|nr:polyamine ABC transporter substrate-binding protein [Nevskiales bacterium]
MQKKLYRILALALTGTLAAGAVQAAELTIISFGGAAQKAQQAAYYEPFAKASGIKVVPGEYNGELAKVKAMVEAQNVSWDVVEMESPELARGCAEGLFETLDMKQIGNPADFVPGAVSPCGVGIFTWSVALAYNTEKLANAPASWADFWDVQKFPGKRGLRKGAKYTLEIALLADGVPMDQVYQVLATPEGVRRAFRKLDQLKPHIQWWEAGAQPPQWLAAGDVVMSSAYNGRISAAIKEGQKLAVVWNQSIYDLDHWAIPKGAKNAKEALQFIAFASKPENQKQFSSLIAYGPSNKQAMAQLDPTVARTLPTDPANLEVAMQMGTDFWVENGEELEEQFNAWAAK